MRSKAIDAVNIALRPLAEGDAAELRRIHELPEVMRWWDVPEEGFPLTDDSESTRFTIEVDGACAVLVTSLERARDLRHPPAVVAASAYRAVADTVITADELAELVKDPDQRELAEPGTEANARSGARAAGNGTKSPTPASAPVPSASSVDGQARKAVLRLVRTADRPLTGGVVAEAAERADDSLRTSSWDGAGSFFPWLARTVPELASASRPAPGYVWDAKRFSEADLPGASGVNLPPLQRQVVDVTDIPNLPAERYRILLTTLADDVRAVPFVRPETSRRVRDACQAAGAPIGRASVNTVIAGVLYAGLDLTAKPSAQKVAETWADNVIGLCRGARMELSPQDVAAIRAWVGGGLLKG
jgi:hypothetical protein